MRVSWKQEVSDFEIYEAGCKTFPCKVPFGRQVSKQSKSESLAGLERGSWVWVSNKNTAHNCHRRTLKVKAFQSFQKLSNRGSSWNLIGFPSAS
jgi:hypothetical protein